MEIGLGVFSGEELAAQGASQGEVPDSIQQARLREAAGPDAVEQRPDTMSPQGHR